MSPNSSIAEPSAPQPVILGAGFTGIAISHSLSAAGIPHVLVGDRPNETPRLGESLNAEGSLAIARQFPDYTRFFFPKRQQALFFGGHAVSFDFIQSNTQPAWYSLQGYPSTVQLLHVDRVGFDGELFRAAIADKNCSYMEDRAAGLSYDSARDRIETIRLASGATIESSYVFDATNSTRFVARKLGLRRKLLGGAQKVVFTHYGTDNALNANVPLWMYATTLLRLDTRTDPVAGLAWCIPLGSYVSVGISIDPATAPANGALLLDWVEKAFATRGMDVRSVFPKRGTPVDFRYEHYNHERCYGRNWLLAGPACCQFWYPAAAGVATGLIAARLAPDVLWESTLSGSSQAPALYQEYVARVASAHSGLEWLVRDDPWSLTAKDLKQRAQAMIGGNVTRLGSYLNLQDPPPELAYGDSLLRMYEGDRQLANPVRVETAAPEAQQTLLFENPSEPGGLLDAPIEVAVLTRPDKLEGPLAILGLVEVLSGRHDVDTSGALITPDFSLQIDQFQLQGIAQWNAWVASLRSSTRVAQLELVPGSLAGADAKWLLTAQWQGLMGTAQSISPEFSMTFAIANERVSAIETHREDYTFVLGDSILPQGAFAGMLGQLAAGAIAAN